MQRVPWSEKFPDADPQALDLMDKMLQFHPGKRIDVATALKHPWLAQLHDETQEPAAPGEARSSARPGSVVSRLNS
jgi:serine/threonine protein kinase